MVAALAFILLEMDVGFVLVNICFERSSAVRGNLGASRRWYKVPVGVVVNVVSFAKE